MAQSTVKWEFWLGTSSTNANVMPLMNIKDRRFKFRLNRPEEMSFTLSVFDPASTLITPLASCIKLYRNGVLVGGGPVISVDYGYPENQMTVRAVGWQELLNYRYLLLSTSPASESVSFVNSNFDTNTTGWTSDATLSRDTTFFQAGSGSLKFSLPGKINKYVRGDLTGSNFKAGRRYPITFYVRHPLAGAGAYPTYSATIGEWTGSAHNNLNSVSKGYTAIYDSAWYQQTLGWTPSADVDADNVKIQFQLPAIQNSQVNFDTFAIGTSVAVERPQVTYNNIAANTIVSNLLSEMTTEFASYISSTVVNTGTQTNRTRTYPRYSNIGQAIQELSDVENGFDYWVDPSTRQVNLVAPPGRGSTKADLLFAYNTGPENIQTLRRSIDGTKVVNKIFVQGRYGTSTAQNSTSQSTYGRMEDVMGLSSVTDKGILDAMAAIETTLRGTPRELIQIVPVANSWPRPFGDYNLGDTIKVIAHDPSTGNTIVNQSVRVFGFEIAVDDLGNESVTTLEVTA